MKLYIGNLSWQTSQEELQSAFERFGTVTDSVVMMDKFTGRSRGFGFVTMSSNAEGQAAMADAILMDIREEISKMLGGELY